MAKDRKRKQNKAYLASIGQAVAVADSPQQLRLAVYARVSTDEQAKSGNINTQTSTINNYIERTFSNRDYEVVGHYFDPGYNMESFEPGRELWRLLAHVEAGRIDAVVVYRDDRLFRGSSEQLKGKIVEILKKNSIDLYRTTSPEPVCYRRGSEFNATLVTTIASAIGPVEKKNNFERQWNGYLNTIKSRGFWFPSCPYGYRAEKYYRKGTKKPFFRLVIVEAEAEVVVAIFKLYVGDAALGQAPSEKGLGYAAIARVLNFMGVDRSAWMDEAALSAKNKWTYAAVKYVIDNDAYQGSKTMLIEPSSDFSASIVQPEALTIKTPAIVSQPLWEQAQRYRKTRAHKHKAKADLPTQALWQLVVFACCSGRSSLMRQSLKYGEHRRVYCNCYKRGFLEAELEFAITAFFHQIKAKVKGLCEQRLAALTPLKTKGSALSELDQRENRLTQEIEQLKRGRLSILRSQGGAAKATLRSLTAELDRIKNAQKKLTKDLSLVRLERANQQALLQEQGLLTFDKDARLKACESIERICSFLNLSLADAQKSVTPALRSDFYRLIKGSGYRLHLSLPLLGSRHQHKNPVDELGLARLTKTEAYSLFRLGFLGSVEAARAFGVSRKKINKTFGSSRAKANGLSRGGVLSLEKIRHQPAENHPPQSIGEGLDLGQHRDLIERLSAAFFYPDLVDADYEWLSQAQISAKPKRMEKESNAVLLSAKKTAALLKKFAPIYESAISGPSQGGGNGQPAQ